jgi:FkbM family methyltransferase
VIDVGSNIGEVSMSIARKHKGITFVCIEPSIQEAECCDLNVFNGMSRTHRIALWSEDIFLDFYHKNETGDSSLLPADLKLKKTSVEARSLDSLCVELGLKRIKLLKLEAEGAEPEVLIGSSKTLQQTKYVAADLGPERGPEKARTYLECYELLAKAGFVEIGSHRGSRETYLFENSNWNNLTKS